VTHHNSYKSPMLALSERGENGGSLYEPAYVAFGLPYTYLISGQNYNKNTKISNRKRGGNHFVISAPFPTRQDEGSVEYFGASSRPARP